MNATDNGVFEGFKVKVGDRVIKNQKAYTIMVGNNKNEPLPEEGTIDSPAGCEGRRDHRQEQSPDLLFQLCFQPQPGPQEDREKYPADGLLFDIFTKKIDRNGVKVDVIEVKDPKPRNPARRES